MALGKLRDKNKHDGNKNGCGGKGLIREASSLVINHYAALYWARGSEVVDYLPQSVALQFMYYYNSQHTQAIRECCELLFGTMLDYTILINE